jgi:hypothetical protein
MAESSRCGTIRKRRHRGSSALLVVILAASSLAAMALPTGAHPIKRSPTGHAAHTLNVNDTAHLHLLRSSGSLLFEEGSTSGGISGQMKANLNVGATFSGSFTIYTSAGTLKGHGTATPHGSGRYESFSGSMVIKGGTGRYAHARGSGGLFGTFDRRTYAFVIQTTGKLSY